MTELKPCPFCGGEANVHSDGDAFSSPFLEIYCSQCNTSMIRYINVLESDEHNREGIIQRWNTRASDWHTGTPTEEGYYLIHLKKYYYKDTVGYMVAKWERNGWRTINIGSYYNLAEDVDRWQKINEGEN